MFRRLYQLVISALISMGSKKYDEVLDMSLVMSDEMQDHIDLCRQVYKDNSPWTDPYEGIYSLGLAKTICSSLTTTMLTEVKTDIVTPGEAPKPKADKTPAETRAEYLNEAYQCKLVKKLPRILEKALATGGVVIKPYINNEKMYFDFNLQGEFIPLSFDDDGTMTDVAFVDQFINGAMQYTKIERQVFEDDTVTIFNRAYVAKVATEDDDNVQDLGVEIPLSKVPRWATLEPEVKIMNVKKPLYGYYRTPIANNVCMNSPLGLPIFSPALGLIERADCQYSRLDWEYEGGQLAIDVDPTAVNPRDGYFGTSVTMDSTKQRLYRKLDLGNDDTYHAFAPQLRDVNYRGGLNSYLYRIEDACGLARGTLADETAEARTATELLIVKQRTQVTISSNQDAMETAIRDAVDALNVYVDLYNLAPDGEWALNVEWKDNVLTDTSTELEEKLRLVDKHILAPYEVRAWYNGEDIETAKAMIEEISESGAKGVLNDIYSSKMSENSLETGEEQAEADDNISDEQKTTVLPKEDNQDESSSALETNRAKANNLR